MLAASDNECPKRYVHQDSSTCCLKNLRTVFAHLREDVADTCELAVDWSDFLRPKFSCQLAALLMLPFPCDPWPPLPLLLPRLARRTTFDASCRRLPSVVDFSLKMLGLTSALLSMLDVSGPSLSDVIPGSALSLEFLALGPKRHMIQSNFGTMPGGLNCSHLRHRDR